ncbi:MAG: DUF6279 family lipoprotein [Burkholderiales bacterium]|nr:DUF6279 family lipoprotein [Burkholderiales bacterium]
MAERTLKLPIHHGRIVLRVFAGVSALLLVAACSMAGMAYNNAVPLASWYIDDYVDLDEAQTARFREGMERLQTWHRKSELPEYSRVLEEAARKVDGPVSAADVRALYDDGRRFANRVGERALGEMADILLTLSPQQIASIEARLKRDNEKIDAERIRAPAGKREKDRAERYVRNLESWLGPLTAEQKSRVQTQIAKVPAGDAMRLADRRRLQGEFLALVRNPPPRQKFIEELRHMLTRPEEGRDPAYIAATREWREQTAALFADTLASATPAQREHLKRKLRGYASDVMALVASN